MSRGIVYEYEDGGRYVGEWEDEKAHGYGVCTGPEGAGLFKGKWERGNQVSGVYTWPSGQQYQGPWENGLREGSGRESKPDGTEYAGEFMKDCRGPFGVLRLPNGAVYRGSWSNGVQEGEGVETYADGGVYCGQYRNGVRHGHGKRASPSYQQAHKTRDALGDSKRSKTKISLTNVTGAFSSSVPTTTGVKVSDSSPNLFGSASSSSSMDSPLFPKRQNFSQPTVQPDPTAQLYMGEWRDDKRHGHGVLEILGLHKYYGQWEYNMRMGYGVLVHADGKKEEGYWQNGKLVNILKRKKIQVSLKGHQMEGKVKQAHTFAIQAAETARNKAMLAETRANGADLKARSAQRTVLQAVQDAQQAIDKAELYKNAPRIAEAIKSPLVDAQMEFPPLDISVKSSTKSSAAESLDFLKVQSNMCNSPSFENLILGPHEANGDNSSGDDESSSPEGSVITQLTTDGREELTDEDLASHIEDIKKKRRKFEKRHASSESSLEGGSLDDDGKSIRKRRPYSLMDGDSGSVKSRKQRLLKMKTISEPEPRLKVERPDLDMRRASDISQLRADRSPPLRRVDKSTGEVGHGDATDEELLEELSEPEPLYTLPPPSRPLKKKPSFTVDMLQQMADWNKMVAYINFALLIFLLLLILVVVIAMNCSILNLNSSAPAAQNPAGFLTPMA